MTTLYLKYRPQNISDLDLSDVRETLSKIISHGDIPHAFLFEGPRGSGKTSAARIIAKVLNCEKLSKNGEPCNTCDECISITKGNNIDVIELDAASHRGIDDVRLLRESVKLAPARSKKKVYIIDEAHMLTTEASNALLKTLEEPPDHVVFILATTNPEKLLDTIKSRTVRVSFKKAKPSEIVRSLTNVLEKEKTKFQNEVLDLISQNCDGSFRDAKKILEELIIKDAVNDLTKAQNYILHKSDFNIDDFFASLKSKKTKVGIGLLNISENAGVPSKSVYGQIVAKLKEILFAASGYVASTSSDFGIDEAQKLTEIFISYWDKYQNDVSEYMPLYLSVIKYCGDGGIEKEKEKEKSNEVSKKERTEEPFDDAQGKHDDEKTLRDVDSQEQEVEKEAAKKTVRLAEGKLPDDKWREVLATVRAKNASTEALLRASKPVGFDGKLLSLGVYYKFHKEKLESMPHKVCLEECLSEIVGSGIKVECFLTEPEIPTANHAVTATNGNSLNGASNLQDAVSSGVILAETKDDELVKLAEEVFGS